MSPNRLNLKGLELGVLEAKVVKSERDQDCADIVAQELMFELAETESLLQQVSERQQCMENSLEEFEKVQDWKADQTEELGKEALAVRQRLQYLLQKDKKFEARISQLQEDVKALREAFSNTAQSQPATKKMPRQPDGPPPKGPRPKKAKAATKSTTKIIVVKCKATV